MAGLEGLADYYDLVIVGAGLSGAVFAEQAASRFGLSSLIIDKRDHIGASPALQRRAHAAPGCLAHCGGGCAASTRAGSGALWCMTRQKPRTRGAVACWRADCALWLAQAATALISSTSTASA